MSLFPLIPLASWKNKLAVLFWPVNLAHKIVLCSFIPLPYQRKGSFPWYQLPKSYKETMWSSLRLSYLPWHTLPGAKGIEMENPLCHVKRQTDQARGGIGLRCSRVLLAGQVETPDQAVPLSVEFLQVRTAGSSFFWRGIKIPKPPEMHLCCQTWLQPSVTHSPLCPSPGLKVKEVLLPDLHAGGWEPLEAQWPALTLAACTIMPTLYLQFPGASPTASCESANILPF